MTQQQIGECAGAMDYSRVAVSDLRPAEKAMSDPSLRRSLRHVSDKCQK